MNPSFKRRLKVLVLIVFFQSGVSACGEVNVISPPPRPSPTPQYSLSDCVPGTVDYTLEITDLKDDSNDTMRSCNARGRITNIGNRDLMFRAYRVNHFGAEDTFGEKWMGVGFMILKVGESAEYGRFHRCTGSHCGEGEWFYIDGLSIYFSDYGCPALVNSVDEPHPESIVRLKNPCDW